MIIDLAARPQTPHRRELEFAFRPHDHRIVAQLVHREIGVMLTSSKAELIYGRLAPRVRACHLASIGEYIERIQADPAERALAIDALTTNHTSFFREQHHFEDFNACLWPNLAARLAKGGRVRLWSAACATGEEPYSWLMAILGGDRDAAAHVLAGDMRLLATDVSAGALTIARAGRYREEAVSTIPGVLRSAWTTGSGAFRTIDPLLRDAIAFRQLNLIGRWPIKARFDAIFCRNTMIYFDEATKVELQSRLADQLEPGGMLYIGHSERLIGAAAQRFESAGRTAYRKVAA